MKKGLFGALAMLVVSAIPGLAEAATRGYSTANVNMRSGPSTSYPAVAVIPNGAVLTIYGCLREVPWCDVSFARGRGWVAGRYVQAVYRQNRVFVEPRYYEGLGVPLIEFDVGNYWDRYYRDRDFYRDRDRWRGLPRRPVDDGWRPPRRDNDWDRPDRRPDRDWDRDRDRDRDRDWSSRPERPRDDGWNRPDRRPDDRRPDNNWNNRPPRGDDGGNRPDGRPPRPPFQEDTGRPQRLPSDNTWTRSPGGSGSSSDQRPDQGQNFGPDLNGVPCGPHGCVPQR